MKKIICCLSVLLASSCSVMVKTPLTRFDSPEARGKAGRIGGLLSYQGRNEVELTPSLLLAPPNLVNPSVEVPGHRLMASGSVGATERFDISLSLPDARLGLKYQLLGDTHETSEAGNIPLAISTSIASASQEDTGTATTTITYKLKELVYDAALISGFRINNLWLIYGGPFILWDDLKTTYRSNSSAASTDNTGTLKTYGANLGVEYTMGKGFFRVEYAGAKTKIGQTKAGRGTYGLAIGAHF
jgi:hypothetical protein